MEFVTDTATADISRKFCNIGALIADSFKVGNSLESNRDCSQIACNRLLANNEVCAKLFYLALGIINIPVYIVNKRQIFFALVIIFGKQSIDRIFNCKAAEIAHSRHK